MLGEGGMEREGEGECSYREWILMTGESRISRRMSCGSKRDEGWEEISGEEALMSVRLQDAPTLIKKAI